MTIKTIKTMKTRNISILSGIGVAILFSMILLFSYDLDILYALFWGVISGAMVGFSVMLNDKNAY